MLPRAQLKNHLHREHTRLTKLLIILAANDPEPARVSEIEQMGVDAGFRDLRGWNISDILRASKGRAILVNGRWELTDAGRNDVVTVLGINGTSPAAAAALDLRAELAKVKDGTTRAFAEEAIVAYETRIYRSAIVMSWVTAMDVLYQAVLDTHLAAFNAEAKRVDNDWKNAKDRDGLALMKERDFLNRTAAIGVIGKNVKATLIECLDRRNGCGHPNSLKLKDRAVAHHVEALVLNVFQAFGAPALSPPPPASATAP